VLAGHVQGSIFKLFFVVLQILVHLYFKVYVIVSYICLQPGGPRNIRNLRQIT
jgi:hypothetical protein